MLAFFVIATFIVGIFVWELGKIWWRETAWRRERERRGDDSD